MPWVTLLFPPTFFSAMRYEGAVEKKIKEAGAEIGDRVRIKRGDVEYEGVLMPRHALTGADIAVLKLDSGYNVGVRISDDAVVELVEKKKPSERKKREIPPGNRPEVHFLSTGGTIASYVDYRTGAVHPAVTAEDLVFSVPEILDLCTPHATVVSSVLSENMTPDIWVSLAEKVAESFKEGAVGVVIPHGTDTMAYTAAALSFMVQNPPGPVVLVGSQRSSDRPSSDATMNLLCATRVAMSPLREVAVVMHAETGDTWCAVHRGTRVRKMHSSRRDAFLSINTPILGRVVGENVELYPWARTSTDGEMVLKTSMERDVALVYFYPGMGVERFRKMVDGARGVVLAGTGLGHVSSDLIEEIKQLTESGVVVAVTTQCLWGRVNLNVYSTGREMLLAGAVPCGDMLPEVAYVKMMWTLGNTSGPEEAKKLLTQPLAGEINPSSSLFSDGFPGTKTPPEMTTGGGEKEREAKDDKKGGEGR